MIKHNKHTIYPCPQNKKKQLLDILLEKYSDMTIAVVNSEFTSDSNGVDFLSYDEFINSDKSYKTIINFNLLNDVQYLEILEKATDNFMALVNEEEQKDLYAIEVVLKRAIRQEKVEGFEYKEVVLEEKKAVFVKKLKEENQKRDAFKKKDGFKKRDDSKKDGAKWEKGGKKPNKFLGKDEKGKAIFSGKSGERNHKYDGTPKSLEEKSVKRVIKKIIIKKESKGE